MAALGVSYDVIAPTQRHFGPGGKASGGFGICTHAEDLLKLLRELRLPKVHLVGWSYGADVALHAAVQCPEQFRSLFLYEPGYPGYLSERGMMEFGMDAQAMFGPIFQLAAEGKTELAVRTLVDGSGNSPGYFAAQPETAQQQQLENMHTLDLQLNQSEKPNLTTDSLAALRLPVSVAFGEDTRPLFAVVAKAAGRLLPDCRTLCVKGANHMLPIADPTRFAELLTAHLRAVPGSGEHMDSRAL